MNSVTNTTTPSIIDTSTQGNSRLSTAYAGAINHLARDVSAINKAIVTGKSPRKLQLFKPRCLAM